MQKKQRVLVMGWEVKLLLKKNIPTCYILWLLDWKPKSQNTCLKKHVLPLRCADVYLSISSAIIQNNFFRVELSLHWLKSWFDLFSVTGGGQRTTRKAKGTNLCWFCCLTDFILLQLVAEHFCLGWRRIRSWLSHTKLNSSPPFSSAPATHTAVQSTLRPCSVAWYLSETAASSSM